MSSNFTGSTCGWKQRSTGSRWNSPSSIGHVVSKMRALLAFWLLKSVGIFFDNSNGKWAKGSLYRWKTKHLMGEHPFTCRVNTLFTHGVEALFTQAVEALFTQAVEALFTHGVEAPFTQVVKALFTQVVEALFTQAVHAYRGKMTMKMPWNKPWFFVVFQNITRAGRKNRKNRVSGKFSMSANQDNSLLSVRWTAMLLWLPRNGWCIEP